MYIQAHNNNNIHVLIDLSRSIWTPVVNGPPVQILQEDDVVFDPPLKYLDPHGLARQK